MQSVDEFTPSTTEPVFGSGLVSQTKSQTSSATEPVFGIDFVSQTKNQTSSTNNENSDNEKIISSSSESVTNGPNNNENVTNDKKESVTENFDADDSTAIHVNGENGKPTVVTTNEIKPTEESIPMETSDQVESTVPSTTEPKPELVLSTPVDTTNEGSSTTMDTAPPPAVETTTTTNDNVPEVPKPTESEATEPKNKSPRGKAKISVVSPTPTRQSTRGRKTASSSSTNIEENQTNDDTGATTTTINQNESSKRTKRQAATIAKDAITASNQPNSTSGSSIADDGNDEDMVPSDRDEDDDITGNKIKKSSPTGRKKRETSPTNATKKSEGKNVQTPPKRARTSSPKKTPEPPSDEYVRKLRPRK